MTEAPAMRDVLGADAPTNWGKWGPDDEVGCLNYLDASEVLRGIRYVRTGEVFTLQAPMGHPKGDPVFPGRKNEVALENTLKVAQEISDATLKGGHVDLPHDGLPVVLRDTAIEQPSTVAVRLFATFGPLRHAGTTERSTGVEVSGGSQSNTSKGSSWSWTLGARMFGTVRPGDPDQTRTPSGVFPQIRTSLNWTRGGTQGQSGNAAYTATLMFNGPSDLWESDAIFRANFYKDDDIGQSRDATLVGSRGTPFRQFVPAQFELATPRLPEAIELDDTAAGGDGRIRDLGQDEARALVTGRSPRTEGGAPRQEAGRAGGQRGQRPPAIELPSRSGRHDRTQTTGQPKGSDGQRNPQPSVHERLRRSGAFVVDVDLDYTLGTGENARDIHLIDAAVRLFSEDVAGAHFLGSHSGYSRKIDHHSSASEGGRLFYPASLSKQNLAPNILFSVATDVDMSGGFWSPNTLRVAMDTSARIDSVAFKPVKGSVIIEGETPVGLSTGIVRTWTFAVGTSMLPSLVTTNLVDNSNNPAETTYFPTFFTGPSGDRSWSLSSRTTGTTGSFSVKRSYLIKSGYSYLFTGSGRMQQAVEFRPDWSVGPTKSRAPRYYGWQADKRNLVTGFMHGRDALSSGLLPDLDVVSDGRTRPLSQLERQPHPPVQVRPGFHGSGTAYRAPDPTAALDALSAELRGKGLELTANSRDDLRNALQSNLGRRAAAPAPVPVKIRRVDHSLLVADLPAVDAVVDISRRWSGRPQAEYTGGEAEFREKFTWTVTRSDSRSTGQQDTLGGGGFGFMPSLPYSGDDAPPSEPDPAVVPSTLAPAHAHSGTSGHRHDSGTAESQTHTVVLAMPTPYTKLTGDTELRLDLRIDTKASHTDSLQVSADLRRDGITVRAPSGTVQELFPAPYLAFGDQAGGTDTPPVRNVPEDVRQLHRNSPREALTAWHGDHQVPRGGRGALVLPAAIENDGRDIRDLAHVVFARSLGWKPEPGHYDADGDYTARAVSAARDFTSDKLNMTSRYQGIDQHLDPSALTGLYLSADSTGGTDLLELDGNKWGLKAEPDLDSGHILDVASTGTVDGFQTDTEAATDTTTRTTAHANSGGPAFGDTTSGTFRPEHEGTQYTSLEYGQGATAGGPSSVTTAPGAPPHGSRLRQGPLYLVEFNTKWAVAAQSGDRMYGGHTDVRMAAWVPEQDALRLGIIDQAKIDAFDAQRRSLSQSQEDLAGADDALLKAQHDLAYAANAVAGGTAPDDVGHAGKQADLPVKLREYDTRLRDWIERLNSARSTLFEDSGSEGAESGSSDGSSDGAGSGSESAEGNPSGDSSDDSSSDSEGDGRRTPDPGSGSARPSTESGPVRTHGTGDESGPTREPGSTRGSSRGTGAGTGRAPEPGTGRAPEDRRFPLQEPEEDPGYESDSEDDLYSATPPRRSTPGSEHPRVPATAPAAKQTGTTTPEAPGSTRTPEPVAPQRIESDSEAGSGSEPQSGPEEVPAPKGRGPEDKAQQQAAAPEQAAAAERGTDSPPHQDLTSIFTAELNPQGQSDPGTGTGTAQRDDEQTTDRFPADSQAESPTESPVIPSATQPSPATTPDPGPRPETRQHPTESDSEDRSDGDDGGTTPTRTEADHEATAPKRHATNHRAADGSSRAEGAATAAARDGRPSELTPFQLNIVRSEMSSLSGRATPEDEAQAAYREWLKLGRPVPNTTKLATEVAYLKATGEPPGLPSGAVGLEGELHSIGLPLPHGYSFDDFDEVVEAPEFSIVLDIGHRGPVLEIVTKPFAVVDGDIGRPTAEQVHRAVQDAVRRLTSARDGARLEQIFADDRFYVDPVAGEFPIRKYGEGDADQVYAHYSAGVPLAGMPQFMRYVGESMRTGGANSTARSQLRDGMWLARGISREAADAHGFSRFERKELEGFLALTYTQFAAIAEQRYAGTGMAKNYAALNSRVDMWEARQSLSPQVQQYLHQSSGDLTTRFAENFRSRERVNRPVVPPLERNFPGGWTLGDYLDGAFSNHPARPVGQYQAMVIRTTMGMDYNFSNGVPMLDPPGLVVELRMQGESSESPHGLQGTAEAIAEEVRSSYRTAQALKRGNSGHLGFTDHGGGPGGGPSGGGRGGYGGSAGGNSYSQNPPPSGGGSRGFGPYSGRYTGQDYPYTGQGYYRAPEPSTHDHDPHDGGGESVDRGQGGPERSGGSGRPNQREATSGNQSDQQRPEAVGPAEDLYDTRSPQSPATPEPADPNDPWGGNPPTTPDFSALIDPKKNQKHTRTIDDIIADLTYRYGLQDVADHAAQNADAQVFFAGTGRDPVLYDPYDSEASDGSERLSPVQTAATHASTTGAGRESALGAGAGDQGERPSGQQHDNRTDYRAFNTADVQFNPHDPNPAFINPAVLDPAYNPAGLGFNPVLNSGFNPGGPSAGPVPAHPSGGADAEDAGGDGGSTAGDAASEADSDAGPGGSWHSFVDGIEDLVQAVDSGISDRTLLTGGGGFGEVVELTTFANGTQAVYKITEGAVDPDSDSDSEADSPVEDPDVAARERADAEHLASLVGRAVGAVVPGVYRTGRHEIYMHYMDGVPGASLPDGPRPQLTRTISGIRLGVMDALTANSDRHSGNWLLTSGGTVVGIDHGAAWSDESGGAPDDPTSLDGIAEIGTLRTFYDFESDQWIRNPLTQNDVLRLEARLWELYPEFVRLGREGWFGSMVARLNMLRLNASGTHDILPGERS